MTPKHFPYANSFCIRQASIGALLAILVLASLTSAPVAADAPVIGLTKIGSPIWRPADFQLFTAPAAPFPDGFTATLDQLLPLEGPSAAVYTPHQPPYDNELSNNAAAAGFVNRNTFPRNAITFDPNGVYLMMMWLPDPGVTGSSRDFASGPVIPNSLFPFSSHAEMWLDGAKVETLQDQMVNIRAGDTGFTGASHRAPSQAVWWPWADDPNVGPLGDHELRWSLRDVQGNGWDIVAAFQVVPEPSTLLIALAGIAVPVGLARRNKR
jgi:hypothetical protein